jgi:tRNA nucleotidyltransferase (CCA-adding enzyme)
MQVRELIATHSNTDFDAFAGMVAAHKLYPEAEICVSGAVNRNVREFRTLLADEIRTVDASHVDLSRVERLILVDTVHPNRLGELAPLCTRSGVEVVVFDHHRPDGGLPDFVRPENFIASEDGSLVTLLLHIISERGIVVDPLEATLFALGIHEDTGSLTFPTTTVRDVEALAFCMRRGANQQLIERFLHNPLSGVQRDLLVKVLEKARPVASAGFDVLVAAVRGADYVEGVSLVAHKAMDMTNCDAFVVLTEMENRVFVTARSRAGALDVAAVLQTVGGGGHAAAASAILKGTNLSAARRRVVAALRRAPSSAPQAQTLMSHPVGWVTTETPVDEALILCERHGYGGLSVADDGLLVGSVARRDLDRAVRHKLGHAPVKAVMTSSSATVAADTPLEELTRVLARDPLGRVPVVREPADRVRVDDVIGVVTRGDLLRALHAAVEVPAVAASVNGASRLSGLGLQTLFASIEAVAVGYRGAYLVGGAVRDLLLGRPLVDIDVAVEGDGIDFAHELAERLGGRVREHRKFQTAVIVVAADEGRPELRVDVASTRTEFYDFPAALPKVEHATIRADLARRDFTINAMAVSLNARDFGTLLDFFGGLDDLEKRRIVVLHNLSFIEDPTRIFRALRYENRYDLRMDRHTLELARSCAAMDLVGDLSSARLRDELTLVFNEERVTLTLRRLRELGLEAAIHPRLALDDESERLIAAADAFRTALGLTGEVPSWRLRLAVLLRRLDAEEILTWARRLRFRRADADVLRRSYLLGVRLEQRLRRPISEADLYELAADQPIESSLIAMALSGGEAAEQRLGHYLTDTRHVRLEIDGNDLLDLGFRESADLGGVLREVLRMRLNGVLEGREQELKAARRLQAPA